MIKSASFEVWSSIDASQDNHRIVTSSEYDLYVNYDKQILIISCIEDRGGREVIPLARVYSIIED